MYGPNQVVEHCGHTFADVNKAKLYKQIILTAFFIQLIFPLG